MTLFANVAQWFLGLILILSSLGVIFARKPIHASLSFMLTLLMLATLYLQLSAQFIAIMQVLVYAGAILVIFVFVIVLFQDAYLQIARFEPLSSKPLLILAAVAFISTLIILGAQLFDKEPSKLRLPEGFGMVESLGQALYVDFFFPFEAIILLFLVAVIGALYIGKKGV